MTAPTNPYGTAPGATAVSALAAGSAGPRGRLPWVEKAGSNQAPVGSDATGVVLEDGVLSATLPAATDADGDPLTYALASNPLHGVATVAANGGYTFTPAADFNGSDVFSYSVSDGQGGISTYLVNVVVTALDDPIVLRQAIADVSTNHGVPVHLQIPGRSFTDVDAQRITLTASRADGSALPVWLHFDAALRTFTGTPALADVGTLALRISASDGVSSLADSFNWTITNLAGRAVSGVVADGHLQGAAIYIDANGNNLPDAWEATGLRTDASGHFAGTVFNSGSLLAVGGRDMASGLDNPLLLRAPAEASVINPLTTLIDTLIDRLGATSSSAQAAIRQGFNLPGSPDLLNYDPVAQGNADATAVAAQRASALVAMTIGWLDASEQDAAWVAMAMLVGAGPAFDLGDEATVYANFFAPAEGEPDDGLAAANPAIAQIVQANRAIQASLTLTQIAAAQADLGPAFRPWDPATQAATALVDALLAAGSGLVVDAGSIQVQYGGLATGAGPSLQSHGSSIAQFSGSVNLGLSRGLLLSTGDATPAQSNSADGHSQLLLAPDGNHALTDAALLAALQARFAGAATVQDATWLQFDFSVTDPAQTHIQFELAFGSDEFPEYSDSPFVDVAAVLLNGVNLALANGQANQPLSIISDNTDALGIRDNSQGGFNIEYDGITVKLSVVAAVQAGTNTIRFTIGDVGDAAFDSGLFVANLRAVAYHGQGLARLGAGTAGDDANLLGTAFADHLLAAAGNDTLTGIDGNDLLAGEAGHDSLRGDAGNDTLDGGAGDDTLDGGADDDTLQGGAGTDLASYALARSAYQVIALRPGVISVQKIGAAASDIDTLIGIESVSFAGQSVALASLVSTPGAPTISGAHDDVGPVTGSIAAGIETDDATPTLSGSLAEPGLVLTVFEGDTLIGTAQVAANNQWSLTTGNLPDGSHTLRARATNGWGLASELGAPFTVLIDAVNQAPVGASLTLAGTEDQGLSANLPAASDADGDTLSYAKASEPAHGSVVVGANGGFVYTPVANFAGSDSFDFVVSDGRGGSASYSVSLSVAAVNDAPVASNGSASTAEDTPLAANLPAASDPDGDTLSYTKASEPAHGSLTVNANGSYVYTPALNYSGADGFTFLVSDGHGGSASYSLSLSVSEVVDTISGSAGNDSLVGTDGPDLLQGLDGVDRLHGAGGNDTLDGGAGIDTVITSVARAGVALLRTGDNWALSGAQGNDSLLGVERLQFTDTHLALDLGGNAGTVAKILGAVFGATSVANQIYFGIGLFYSDGGMAYAPLMQLALDAKLGGGASHAAVVNLLYTNLVGSAPGPADLAHFVGLLDSQQHTPASLGLLAADHALNLANINLVGLADSGVGFVPYLGG